MSKAVHIAKKRVLMILSGVLGSILSMLGVLSTGCSDSNPVSPSYGPPSTTIVLFGAIRSSADSTFVPGIEISALNADSTTVVSSTLTDAYGNYQLYLDSLEYPWPDTLLVTATDVDGALNGSFLIADSLVFPEVENPYLEIEMDFYLETEDN
jgi:hypothetical protein